jgi:hypothetical protein
MALFGFHILRASTVQRHAEIIAGTLRTYEREGSHRAMKAHHNALADAAVVLGLDLAPLSGGTPKPPRED